MAAKTLFLPLLILALAAPARAALQPAGKEEAVPEVQDLAVNRFRLAELSEPLSLTPEDLEGGIVTLRGRAVMEAGTVAAVEVSLDGATTWTKAQLSRNGQFQLSFRPEPGRQYRLAFRAVSKDGKRGEAEEAAYAVSLRKVDESDLAAQAREVFLKMIEDYSNARASEVKRHISDDFYGNRLALEDAIDNDLRLFRNVRIRPKISRVSRNKDDFEISFSYDRKVTSVRSGQVLSDQSSSVVTFRREGKGLKLLSMAAPLLFGVSDTSEVSTSVTQQSVGQSVLTVTSTGETTTQAQSETPSAPASDVRSGSAALAYDQTATTTESFDFETQTEKSSVINDVSNGGTLNGHLAPLVDFTDNIVKMATNGQAAIQLVGSGSLSSFTTAPDGGYADANGYTGAVVAQGGSVYALKTSGNIFALFRVTTTPVVSGGAGAKMATLSIEYKVQMSGGRTF